MFLLFLLRFFPKKRLGKTLSASSEGSTTCNGCMLETVFFVERGGMGIFREFFCNVCDVNALFMRVCRVLFFAPFHRLAYNAGLDAHRVASGWLSHVQLAGPLDGSLTESQICPC